MLAALQGSSALAGVQQASERVWQSVLDGALGDEGSTWYKACLDVVACEDGPWTVAAEGAHDKQIFKIER